jgi:adenylate cyclase
MSVSLESLATCFQGLWPAHLFTCSSDGIPNAAYLSHVDYVDAEHVALSFQFFNKSRRNVAENPHALVKVIDPDTGQGWRLRLHYVRSETSGPLFERMALRIEAIASYCGLKGIFKLRAADVYRVRAIEPVPEECGAPGPSARSPRQRARSDLHAPRLAGSGRSHTPCRLLDGLVDSILGALDEAYGFKHSMILVPGEQDGVLVTLATHGYPESGAGAEVRYGEGIAGLVAEARKPIRISGLMRGMLYALAMHQAAQQPNGSPRARHVALPGLPHPESQLGVPLLVRGDLVGVLCLESEVPYRFHEEDKASIELLGSYLAIAIQNMQLHERAADTAAGVPPPGPARVDGIRTVAVSCEARHDIVFHLHDECILVDDEYLIRGLPAKILWRLLTIRESSGRQAFTNRELRLDRSLQLPEWRDNLESRLILLRRRLEQKCPDIRIVPCGRGRFTLDVACHVTLTTVP